MLLNHQSPGPSIPRFNPHGYQAPPQERKKEEASPAKPFGVVKKRQEEKEMIDFKNFNIEDLLGDKVSNPFAYKTQWFFIFSNNSYNLTSFYELFQL